MGRIRSAAVAMIALVLLGGAAVLAVLQVRWVTAASRDEESHLRATLALGLSRVGRDAEDEIRFLTLVLRPTVAELRAGDWTGISSALETWYDTTDFPGLLKDLYVVPEPGSATGLVYDRSTARLRPVVLPAPLVARLRGTAGASPGGTAPDEGYILLHVGEGPRGDGDEPGARSVVALDLDAVVIYTRLMPTLVEKHLAGFPYRVVSEDRSTILHQSGLIPANGTPEATLAPTGLFARGSLWMEGLLDPPGEQTLRSWFLKLRQDRDAPVEPDIGVSPGVRLEIYYPGGSIEAAVRTRRAVNLLVGGGILAVLVLGALWLYRLYHRSARLRSSEQEFIATVSHELRTPITVIQATSENLRRGIVSQPDRVTLYGGVINEQARRLSGMVEAVLYYSGLESGRERDGARVPISLSAFLSQTLDPLRELAAGREKTLQLAPAGEPDEVPADATALRVVLENLVMNAIHHADPGEIRVSVRAACGGGLGVVVEDDGPGIPAREQKKVFQRFVRGERSTRDQHPGSGLGLHLVARVARMAGGEVTLESPYSTTGGLRSAGCRFTVRLP